MITQIAYEGWPDMGVPEDAGDFLRICCAVDKMNPHQGL